MIRPVQHLFDARFYDGSEPVSHRATVEFYAMGLRVYRERHLPAAWPYSSLRFVTDGAYGEPVRIENEVGEALVVESPAFVEALREFGARPEAKITHPRTWYALVACCILVIALAVVYYRASVAIAAEAAARFMPQALEDKLGRSVIALMAPENSRCTGESTKLLDPVIDRLQAVSRAPYPFRVIYVNLGVVNAFAAPGGYVVVFRGLLDQSETAEEFAGVLAHEMEHVVLKHSMRALAREFSGRALLSLMAIDSSGTPGAIQAGAQLASLSYARDDEQAADLEGAALLERAHVSTNGLAAFFRRIQQQSPDEGPNYMATHPATAERIERLNEATRSSPYAAPLMTAAEWQRIRRVCANR